MKNIIIIGMLVLALFFSCTKTSKPAAEQAAVSAATEWLALVDSGKYAQSWETSADIFQAAITKDAWERQLHGVRKPLGKLISRDVKSSQYHTSLPGAPDGEYVVIAFQTSYENKKSAVETVTPKKDSLGAWRVSGYYIR